MLERPIRPWALLVGGVGVVLLVIAGVMSYNDGGDDKAYAIGSGFGRVAGALMVAALAFAGYQRFVAKRAVSLRSPYLLFVAGVAGVAFSLAGWGGGGLEEQPEPSFAEYEEGRRCRLAKGDPFERVPRAVEAPPASEEEVSAYQARAGYIAPGVYLDMRELWRRGGPLGRAIFLAVEPESRSADKALSEIKLGVEHGSGAVVSEVRFGGRDAVAWAVPSGGHAVAGQIECGMLVVSTFEERDARQIWRSVAGG